MVIRGKIDKKQSGGKLTLTRRAPQFLMVMDGQGGRVRVDIAGQAGQRLEGTELW